MLYGNAHGIIVAVINSAKASRFGEFAAYCGFHCAFGHGIYLMVANAVVGAHKGFSVKVGKKNRGAVRFGNNSVAELKRSGGYHFIIVLFHTA